MKKIFLSICLLFSVVIATVSEEAYDQYKKMTIAEYKANVKYKLAQGQGVRFDDVYIMGINHSDHSISFYDDTAAEVVEYGSLSVDDMRKILDIQRQGKRVTLYAHGASRETRRVSIYLFTEDFLCLDLIKVEHGTGDHVSQFLKRLLKK